MKQPLTHEYNPKFQKYIDLVPKGQILELLREDAQNIIQYFGNIPLEKQGLSYQIDKWTIKEILMHLIDTERIMSYRALVAARGDSNTILYGADENVYARNIDVTNRNMESLLSEFSAVRIATEKLFENLTDNHSKLLAKIDSHPISARALGYIIIGHNKHHIRVIKEKYL